MLALGISALSHRVRDHMPAAFRRSASAFFARSHASERSGSCFWGIRCTIVCGVFFLPFDARVPGAGAATGPASKASVPSACESSAAGPTFESPAARYDTRGIFFLPFDARGPGVRLTHPSAWRQPARYLLAPPLASTRIYCIRTTSLCMLCKVFLTLPGFSTRKVNILKCFPNAIRWFCTLRGPVIPSCGLAAHCMAFYHMHCFKI